MSQLTIHQEFDAVAMALDNFHGVFSTLWRVGVPSFSEETETACIVFVKGKPISFVFNPKFWKSLDTYTRSMVVCHEVLHVMFQHGQRAKDVTNHAVANIAMDVVVNHTLISEFGFDRTKIQGQEKLCWLDTVFEKEDKIEPDREFEYYHGKLLKPPSPKSDGKGKNKGNSSDGAGGIVPSTGADKIAPSTLDDHDWLSSEDQDAIRKAMADALKDTLSPEEAQDFINRVTKGGLHAGKDAAGVVAILSVTKVVTKKKWESVIKKWARMAVKDEDNEQWAKIHRRLSFFSDTTVMLPSDADEEKYQKDRILVYFYLDASGSCWDLKDRFFTAARSLDTTKFQIRLFSFDTAVYPADINVARIQGGGGTAFGILEQAIQRDLASGKLPKYPDAVFLITDGYGTSITVQYPKKWYWFLTAHGSRTYIPKDSNVFDLEKFE